MNPPGIPMQLHNFVRPKERLPLMKIEHNWVDIISYPISTIIKVYGFLGQPHVLPYNVPLRLGFAKVLWQVGCIHDKEIKGRGKGTIFPNYTFIPYFAIMKWRYVHFDKLFAPYHLGVSTFRHSDLKGFYNIFRQRIKGGPLTHEHNFLEDLIRNEFYLMTQYWRKEKWIAFRELWTIVKKMDPRYDPLRNFTPFYAKVDFVMNIFDEWILALKEKRAKLEEAHDHQVERRRMQQPTPITPEEATTIHQMRMKQLGSPPPPPHMIDGLEESRPSYVPPRKVGVVIKRVREEVSSEE